jgi:S-adenosyl-L-methionine hydrolase (adenosine-forming)
MIVLFTDFGLHGPYAGQMKAVLHQMVPGTSIVDLFADAPVGNPKASAYLLPVYAAWFPVDTVFLCVVDPGVGGVRPPIILEADGRWYVGPGNGLFELVQRRAGETRSWHIDWKPERLSASFHGRDPSLRSRPCWRVGSRLPAGHTRICIAAQIGRTTSARSCTLIISATP